VPDRHGPASTSWPMSWASIAGLREEMDLAGKQPNTVHDFSFFKISYLFKYFRNLFKLPEFIEILEKFKINFVRIVFTSSL
jgi:hypothetical protein